MLKLFEPEQSEVREESPVPASDAPPKPRSPRLGARRLDLPTDVGELHLLVEELQDERSSSRWREAMWISIIVHLVIFILLANSTRIFPQSWFTPVQLAKVDTHQPTFLTLPPDAQKYIPKRPKTDILSDKNRVASSQNPNDYRPTPEEIERMRRQGRPGQQQAQQARQQTQQAAPPQQAAQAQPQQQPQRQQEPPAEAKLREPEQPPAPRPNPFGSPSQSAGSAIQDAVRAATNTRGFGSGGDYGAGIQRHAGLKDQAEVLSDTQGWDYGPYLARVVNAVRINWYKLIPEEAGPPFYRTGVVVIDFEIRRNGSVGPIIVRSGSGTTSLDHAAFGGITASNPFNPLPGEYKGDELKLRFSFHYLGPIRTTQ